jgi:hypothetical protein
MGIIVEGSVTDMGWVVKGYGWVGGTLSAVPEGSVELREEVKGMEWERQ